MPSDANRQAAINDLGAAMAAAMGQAIQPLVQSQQDQSRAANLASQGAQQSSDSSDSQGKKNQKDNAGLLKSIVQNISLPLPGGARLFGLSSFMDKLDVSQKKFKKGQADIAKATKGPTEKQRSQWEDIKGHAVNLSKASQTAADAFLAANKDMDPENIQKDLDVQAADAMKPGTHALNTLTIGLSAAAAALTLVTEGLRALGKSLGGVSEGQAFSEMLGSIGQSIAGIAEGRLRFPGRTLEMQGAAGQEFGQLATSEAAATMADVVTDFGITTNQMAKLERTFQSTAMDSRTALSSFADAGMLGQTAATELAANAGAVARAGDNFNEFIRDGIVNAKKLGLEFSKMESTLTGFTMDFEGTVSGFSELRAVIPGMATDFGQLLTTAMTGTTDEYVEQIRSSLLGAGISDASQMNRQQAALLEQATGFSADQIDRILAGEDLNANIEQDLTKKTHLLFVLQMGILGTIAGATVAGWSVLLAHPFFGSVGALGVLGGAKTGAVLGIAAGATIVGTGMLDDAYITKEGKTIPFSEDDNILLSKRGLVTPDSSTPSVQPTVGGDNSAMVAALGRIENILSSRQVIDLRGGQAFVERNMRNSHEGEVRMGVA